MKTIINVYDEEVEISISQDQQKAIINRIVQYMADNECTLGESLVQNDECIINAPNCLAQIIDNHMTIRYK